MSTMPYVWVGVMHAAYAHDREQYLRAHHEQARLTGWIWHIERDETARGPVDVAMSIWRTGLRGIESQGLENHGWIVLLNDDVVFAPDFATHLICALKHAPTNIVCMYNNHPRAEKFFERKMPYYTSFDGLVSVGCAVQYWTARGFVEAVDSGVILQQKNAEDSMLATYAMMRGMHITHTLPALVDHAAPDTSLLAHEHHAYRTAAVGKDVWERTEWHDAEAWWGKSARDDQPPVVTYRAMVDRVVLGVRPDAWAKHRCIEKLIAMKRVQRKQT